MLSASVAQLFATCQQLQIQNRQMQEAMLSIQKVSSEPSNRSPDNYLLSQFLEYLPASAERTYLQQGLHALQRRSGPLKMTVDDFAITSLDVIVHEHRKLGAGGFAEVYEADWKGNRVAVKVLEKGLPPSVLEIEYSETFLSLSNCSQAIEEEVNVWKRLRHPNILEFFGSCPIA